MSSNGLRRRRLRRAAVTSSKVRYSEDRKSYPASNRSSALGPISDSDFAERTINDPSTLQDRKQELYSTCKKMKLKHLRKLPCYLRLPKGYRIPWWQKREKKYVIEDDKSYQASKSVVNGESLCRFFVSTVGMKHIAACEEFKSVPVTKKIQKTVPSKYSTINLHFRKPGKMKKYMKNGNTFYTVEVPQKNTQTGMIMMVDLVLKYTDDQKQLPINNIRILYGNQQLSITQYLESIEDDNNVRTMINSVTDALNESKLDMDNKERETQERKERRRQDRERKTQERRERRRKEREDRRGMPRIIGNVEGGSVSQNAPFDQGSVNQAPANDIGQIDQLAESTLLPLNLSSTHVVQNPQESSDGKGSDSQSPSQSRGELFENTPDQTRTQLEDIFSTEVTPEDMYNADRGADNLNSSIELGGSLFDTTSGDTADQLLDQWPSF